MYQSIKISVCYHILIGIHNLYTGLKVPRFPGGGGAGVSSHGLISTVFLFVLTEIQKGETCFRGGEVPLAPHAVL